MAVMFPVMSMFVSRSISVLVIIVRKDSTDGGKSMKNYDAQIKYEDNIIAA